MSVDYSAMSIEELEMAKAALHVQDDAMHEEIRRAGDAMAPKLQQQRRVAAVEAARLLLKAEGLDISGPSALINVPVQAPDPLAEVPEGAVRISPPPAVLGVVPGTPGIPDGEPIIDATAAPSAPESTGV